MKIQIVVAAHKPYRMPKDPVYLPVQAGRALHEPLAWQGDDTGENISAKNGEYCELTCLYWAWKNLDADAAGMCHYRRYFAGRRTGPKWERILTGEQAERLLERAPVLLPKPRRYYIDTNFGEYSHAHNGDDLAEARKILAERSPAAAEAYDRVMARTWGHRFNMFVMKREQLDRYCAWIFDILFELERRIDISDYDPYNRRVFGFISERLLDVWLEAEHIQYLDVPVVNLESQHWPRKIAAFVKRRLWPKKLARKHG